MTKKKKSKRRKSDKQKSDEQELIKRKVQTTEWKKERNAVFLSRLFHCGIWLWCLTRETKRRMRSTNQEKKDTTTKNRGKKRAKEPAMSMLYMPIISSDQGFFDQGAVGFQGKKKTQVKAYNSLRKKKARRYARTNKQTDAHKERRDR